MAKPRSSNLHKVRTRPNKQPSKSLVITLGAAGLLIVGGGLAYVLSRGGSPETTLPVGVTLLPQNTQWAVSLTTHRNQWQQFSRFNAPETIKVVQSSLVDLDNTLLKPYGLNFDKDIRPWVGDSITAAQLAPAAQGEEKLAPQSQAWILPVRDQGKAQRFLNEGANKTGQPLQPLEHQGVQMRTLTSGETSLTIAILEGSFLVITNDIPSMRQMIDATRQRKSLATLPRFQSAMKLVYNREAFGHLYLSLPANTGQIIDQQNRQVEKSTLDRLQNIEGFGVSIELQENGVSFKSISWLKEGSPVPLTPSTGASNLSKLLPDDTLMMASGDNFQQVWSDYKLGNETQLILPFSPTTIQKEFQKSFNIDFEKSFLPWMKGEYVSALVPTNQQNSQGAGVVFFVQAGDRSAAENSMRELEAAVRERHKVQTSETKIDGRSVVLWRVPPNLVVASRGWLDNKVMFFTFGAPITNRITQAPKNNLTQSDPFKTATQSSEGLNSGQFFLDVPRTTTFSQTSKFLPKIAPSFLKYTQEINALGATSNTPNNWSTRYDINLEFRK